MVKQNLHKLHYKEKDPIETVNYLKEILKKLNIKVEERWSNKSLIDTYSLRLCFKGTDIGTNGKGVTKDFARASAYGEFFERLQNSSLIPMSINNNKKHNFHSDPYEAIIDIKDFFEENNCFAKYMKDNASINISSVKKNKLLKNFLCISNGKHSNDILCIPFYDVIDSKIVYCPLVMQKYIYGSNGMAGGNTPYEAIVEGISEILERKSLSHFFTKKTTPPDIPDKHIKQYSNIYKKIEKLKSDPRFEVMIKDCSLGQGLPVAALILVNKNSGKYGVKFGCHPNMEIAIERTLTEACQGKDITDYSMISNLDFFDKKIDYGYNRLTAFRTGKGQFFTNIFNDKPSYKFKPWKDVKNYSNKDLVDYYIKFISSKGYKILIRDVSYLSFPSYHIIIPNMTETRTFNNTMLHVYQNINKATKLIENVSTINKNNCSSIIKSWNWRKENDEFTHFKYYIHNYNDEYDYKIPFGPDKMGFMYLISMCYFMKKKYRDSYKILNEMQKFCINQKFSGKDFLIDLDMIKNYVAARCVGKSHTEAYSYIKKFYTDNFSNKIDIIFKDGKKILTSQFPKLLPLIEKNKNTETEKNISKIASLLYSYIDSNKIDQMNLKHILKTCS